MISQQQARGAQGPNLPENFRTIPKESGLVKIEYGAFLIGDQDEKEVGNIRSMIEDWQQRVISWQEYNDLKKYTDRLLEIKDRIRDELAVIILRRRVPGHCRYCPL